jgi:hypothetical protein
MAALNASASNAAVVLNANDFNWQGGTGVLMTGALTIKYSRPMGILGTLNDTDVLTAHVAVKFDGQTVLNDTTTIHTGDGTNLVGQVALNGFLPYSSAQLGFKTITVEVKLVTLSGAALYAPASGSAPGVTGRLWATSAF